MSASIEFPGDQLTNTYILDGFGQLHYSVYVIGSPPKIVGSQSSPPVVDVRSSLRAAQKELHDASFLATLDPDRNELFAFLRMSEIKDRKALVGRLSPILKRNRMISSYNTAVKVQDLLKNEDTRLLRLLLVAIYETIDLGLDLSDTVLPLGSRTFLERGPKHDFSRREDLDQRGLAYRMHKIDLQLLNTGRLVLTRTARVVSRLRSISDVARNDLVTPFLVLMAPTGQLARYTGERARELSQEWLSKAETTYHELWREHCSTWLKDNCVAFSPQEDDLWVEVEIPVHQRTPDTANQDGSSLVTWKHVLYPASLCFFRSREPDNVQNEIEMELEDPLQFVEDWYASSKQRAALLASKRELEDQVELSPTEVDLDSPRDRRMEDILHFQHFQPELAPGQMMYPTPPDGPLTQATPGMNSVDGIGLTPVDVPHVSQQSALDDVDDVDDEMPDVNHASSTGIGTGFYDEDLFEEIPEDKYAATGVADEPNWDFFDKQDFGDQVNAEMEKYMKGAEGTAERPTTVPIQETGKSQQLKQEEEPNIHAEEMNTTEYNAEGADTFQPARHQDPMIEEPTLKDEIDTERQPSELRRQSLYAVSAIRNTTANDERYAANGRFWFETSFSGDGQEDTHIRPQPENNLLKNTNWRSVTGIRSPFVSSDESDSASSEYWTSPRAEDVPAENPYRKWTEYSDIEPPLESPSLDPKDLVLMQAEIQQLLDILKTRSIDDTITLADLRLLDLRIQPRPEQVEDPTAVAQLLVNQLTQSFLQIDTQLQSTPDFQQRDIDFVYERCENARLKTLTLSFTNVDSSSDPNRIYKMDEPRVSIGFSDKHLTISPTALPMWEKLSLQPNAGEKNVTAFCVCSTGQNEVGSCQTFLQQITETYIGCGLGSHNIAKGDALANDGVVQWSNLRGDTQGLRQRCQMLGAAIGQTHDLKDNVVIYIVQWSPDISAAVQICTAFYGLLQSYNRARGRQPPVELVLQIVPRSFIASSETLVIPSLSQDLMLALEVYNRCPSTDLTARRAHRGLAVELAEPQHKRIAFNLSTTSTTPIVSSPPSIHMAYSESIDQRWLTAAWCDERGCMSLTMSYNLQPQPTTHFERRSEVLKDIWDVTLDLTEGMRNTWRLIVARDTFFAAEDINTWTHLWNNSASTSKGRGRCDLLLVSLDLDPALTIPTVPEPSNRPTHTTNPSSQPTTSTTAPLNYSTPLSASTPQAATTTSPEQLPTSASAATPTPTPTGTGIDHPLTASFDFTESDLTITDPSEESWSVILGYGINQSHRITTICPALASGYLLKRAGPREDDGVMLLGINLVYTSSQGHNKEEVLKEAIQQYRDLVTLARTRGVGDGVVPWHVATAVRGARILGDAL